MKVVMLSFLPPRNGKQYLVISGWLKGTGGSVPFLVGGSMFEIWHNSKCIALRKLNEVKEEYHLMKLGESRMLYDDIWIMRVK
jgi:hypothetical protein